MQSDQDKMISDEQLEPVLLDVILALIRGDLPSNFDKLVGWILQEDCN